jgi:hypothetical protein
MYLLDIDYEVCVFDLGTVGSLRKGLVLRSCGACLNAVLVECEEEACI